MDEYVRLFSIIYRPDHMLEIGFSTEMGADDAQVQSRMTGAAGHKSQAAGHKRA